MNTFSIKTSLLTWTVRDRLVCVLLFCCRTLSLLRVWTETPRWVVVEGLRRLDVGMTSDTSAIISASVISLSSLEKLLFVWLPSVVHSRQNQSSSGTTAKGGRRQTMWNLPKSKLTGQCLSLIRTLIIPWSEKFKLPYLQLMKYCDCAANSVKSYLESQAEQRSIRCLRSLLPHSSHTLSSSDLSPSISWSSCGSTIIWKHTEGW